MLIAVLAARTKKGEMVGELSLAESRSHKLKDEVVSLCVQVDSLRLELASSLKEASRCRHKANGTKRDSLATRLKQMKEVDELKKAKTNYATHLLNSKEECREANTLISIAEGEKVKGNEIW